MKKDYLSRSTRGNPSGRPMGTVGLFAMMVFLTSLAAVASPPFDWYTTDGLSLGMSGNVTIPSTRSVGGNPVGTTIEINTSSSQIRDTTPGYTGETIAYGEDKGGVIVFGFQNLTIASGVTIDVVGNSPFSLVAKEDMFVGSAINVAAQPLGAGVDPRSGGGKGGGGGFGGTGGRGGDGNTGGAGGGGGIGGIGATGDTGRSGSNGNVGAGGSVGGTGLSGNNGSNGQNGFAGLGGFGDYTALPATGGQGGQVNLLNPSAPGRGGLGIGGGGSGGGATSVGGGSSGAGGTGGNGSNGGDASQSYTGQVGATGSVGSNAAWSSDALTWASKLDLAAGHGGGGGGGGSGGGGGGGGSGGGGGGGGAGGGGGGSGSEGYGLYNLCSGAGGGGGGGGGAGGAGGGAGGGGGGGGGATGRFAGNAGSTAAFLALGPTGVPSGGGGGARGGNGDMSTTVWPQAGYGGSGGGGGTYGGTGGSGGAGGGGGVGAQGASGGGAFILAARGLLRIDDGVVGTNVMLNTSPALPISAGGAGGGGANGAGGQGGNGGAGGGGGGDGGGDAGGNGGAGGTGGTGGSGGLGGYGGTGGVGGGGGYGLPGMVKLQGSVIQASDSMIRMLNTIDTQQSHNGMFTIISNMNTTYTNSNAPVVDNTDPNSAPQRGAMTRNELKEANPYLGNGSGGAAAPLIPTMIGGPASHGFYLPDFFNKSIVSGQLAGAPACPYNSAVKIVRLTQTNGPTPFSGPGGYLDQIVIANTSATEDATLICFVKNGEQKFVNWDAVAGKGSGYIATGKMWTTTVYPGDVIDWAVPIQIVDQPVGGNVYAGSGIAGSGPDIALSAKVQYGVIPVTYQWQFRSSGGQWQNITGGSGNVTMSGADAGTARITIADITTAKSGTYRCVFQDLVRTLTTDNAVITVSTEFAITGQPEGAEKYVGDAHTFAAAAAGGLGELTYEWYHDDGVTKAIVLVGENADSLTIPYLNAVDSGVYYCRVTDDNGTWQESEHTSLTVKEKVTMTDPVVVVPGALVTNLYEGSSWSISVSAAGGYGTLTYRWTKGTDPSVIGTSATLAIPAVSLSSAGQYQCEVRDAKTSTAASDSIELTVAERAVITLQPVGAVKTEKQSHTFTTAATGGLGTLHYQWKKDGINILGAADAPTYTKEVLALSDSGSFTCEITDGGTEVLTTDAAVLQVNVGEPATGALGLAIMAAACALGGALVLVLRRRA